MATRLYFHNAVSSVSGLSIQSTRTKATATGADTLRTMDTTIGTSQTSMTSNTQAITTAQSALMGWFCSPPLSGSQTVGATGMVLNVADSESNTNANFWVNDVIVYIWRPSTSTRTAVFHGTTLAGVNRGGTEPTAANSEQVSHITGITSIGSTVAADGDIIVVEVYAYFTQGMSTAYTGTMYYDGTTENTTENAVVSNHASFLELVENLNFQATSSYTPVNPFGTTGFFGI